jgi:hypothetical protein
MWAGKGGRHYLVQGGKVTALSVALAAGMISLHHSFSGCKDFFSAVALFAALLRILP